MKTNYNRFLFIIILFGTLNACTFEESLKLEKLSCMYLENPIGIDTETPIFSWQIQSANSDVSQQAYQILVASSREKLSKDEGDFWDSERVESRNSIQIQYNGKNLETAKKYFWKVKAWDNKGNVSEWSDPSFWSMGILKPEQWKAKWILNDYSQSASMPLFRKEFDIRKEVKQASVFISGLGYSETYLNGNKLGESVLDPAQTNYESYAYYVSHDVSTSLIQGENMLGVMLGDGWYNQDKAFGADFSYGKPKMICQLMVEYIDGEKETIISDSSWEWADGPVISANVYAGENYDARKELKNWSVPANYDGQWKPAILAENYPPNLKPQMLQPIKKMKELTPVNFYKIDGDKYIFDLGQNFAGWVRIKVKEESGTTIQLRMSEEVYKDGSLDVESTGVFATLFEQTETYTCKGEGVETWEPRFTYHGFRYVEVSGLSEAPNNETIKGIVVYSSVPEAGSFQCSNENINRLHDMAIWTQISNLHGVPTDCPHREKCGWLGDAHAIAPMTIYNFGMEAFWIKYLADIRSSAAREGITIHHKASNRIFYQAYKEPGIPFMIAPGKRECGAASSDWGTALTQIPWYLYLYYGNMEILHEYYPDMKVWVSYLENLAVDYLILEGLGDWCPPGIEGIDCPYEISSSAFYYYDLTIMENSAKLFNLSEEEVHYKNTREAVKEAFISRFYDPTNHSFGSQTANVLALDFGLVPAGDERAVSDAIVKDMDENHSGFNHTGIFGLSRIFEVLARNGHEDVAFRMLTASGKLSFENMWKIYDATTFWEILPIEDYPDSLKSQFGNQSHNHPMQGGFDAWFYKGIAGISPIKENPGFATIQFEPFLIGEMEWAKASYESVYGEINSSWKWDNEVFKWEVDIPCNADGNLIIPFSDYSSLFINGNKLTGTSDEANTSINLKSGHHKIEITR